MLYYLIAAVIIIVLLGFAFLMIYSIFKHDLHGFFTMKKLKAGKNLRLIHVYGLPASQFLPCYLYITKKQYIFEIDKRFLRLDRDKIIDKNIYTDMDVKKQAVSDVGSAIAGAKAFGAIGALTANKAAVVDVTTIKKILVLKYKNENDEITDIGLDYYERYSDDDIRYYFSIKSTKEATL